MKNKILVINNIQNLTPSQIDIISKESVSYKLQINQLSKLIKTEFIYLDDPKMLRILKKK